MYQSQLPYINKIPKLNDSDRSISDNQMQEDLYDGIKKEYILMLGKSIEKNKYNSILRKNRLIFDKKGYDSDIVNNLIRGNTQTNRSINKFK